MNVLLLLIFFSGIVIFEVPGLVYRKYWKELIVFFLFWGFAFIISLLAVLGVTLPSPAKGIEKAITFIFTLLRK
ncbi:MAG: hypothetical protein GXW85_04335 [Clostridia bacterium]|nr:hypothetical protein [Clostridia bacterium]